MHWTAWTVLALLVFLVLTWVVHGRRQYDFVGLLPLIPGEKGIEHLGYSDFPEGIGTWPTPPDDRAARQGRGVRGGANVGAAPTGSNAGGHPDSDTASNTDTEADPDSDVDAGDTTLDTSEEVQLRSRGGTFATVRPAGQRRRGGPRRYIDEEEAGLDGEVAVSIITPVPYRDRAQSSRKEEVCRQILEELYGLPFPKVRPDFLRNPETGRNLEIDGYCHELRLGFEFNGEQHYNYPNHYHRSTEEFLRQVRRDNYKAGVCRRLGVRLIVVPHNIPEKELRSFILAHLPTQRGGSFRAAAPESGARPPRVARTGS